DRPWGVDPLGDEQRGDEVADVERRLGDELAYDGRPPQPAQPASWELHRREPTPVVGTATGSIRSVVSPASSRLRRDGPRVVRSGSATKREDDGRTHLGGCPCRSDDGDGPRERIGALRGRRPDRDQREPPRGGARVVGDPA